MRPKAEFSLGSESSGQDLSRRRSASPSEQENEHKPGHETSDMRHIGNAAGLAADNADLTEYLKEYPQAEYHKRRHVDYLATHQDPNAAPREEHEIRAEDARDRAGRTETRDDRIRPDHDMRSAGSDTAY